MRTIHRDIVTVLLISRDEKIFLALRNPMSGGVYPLCWSLVGGGIEHGEDKEEALIREVKEEIGINLTGYPTELIDEATGEDKKTLETGEVVICEMKFYTYKVFINDKKADEIAITLNSEHTQYNWFAPAEVKNVALTPQLPTILTKLGYV